MTERKRNFLISGCSSGIGKKFLELLLSKNESVIPIVRQANQLDSYPITKHIEYDFAKPTELAKSFNNFDEKIDVFVNFAALLPGKSYMEYDHAAIQEIMDINVISPILLAQQITPHLSDNAVLIFFGSVSAQKGSYDDVYAASKGAVHSLIKSLSLKLAPHHRVLGLAPSMTKDTRMTDELIEGRFEHNLKTIPLRRAGDPQEIAELVYFLTSKSCGFMTGSLIDINGGQYLR